MPNKKSQVEDWLPLILIIVVLTFLLFYISFSEFESEKTAQELVLKKIQIRDTHDILSNYLKSPLSLEKIPDANIADGIGYYSVKDDAELLNKIQIATDDFFSKSSLGTDYSSYSLEITYAGKELVLESKKSRKQLSTKEELSKISIPTPYKDDLINLRLFLITLNKCKESKDGYNCQ